MTDLSPIRIGIVGAGENTRVKHIPGLRAIDGVEIVSVVNRNRESSERVEEEFIGAIRGPEPITHTTFEDGVKNMAFTDAVARSMESGHSEAV